MGTQLDVLIGSHGLEPAADLLSRAATEQASFLQVPTVFKWFGASDGVLAAGAWFGVGLSALALLGVVPRLCFLLLTPLYVSYMTLGGSFFAFQWDNLLVECGALAIFLPRRTRGRWIHLLFMALCFKLYFESGLAKWQSHLRDWHDGSAMTYYYETSPIPAWLGWYAHHLPRGWHLAESRVALELELIAPLFVFAPRLFRLVALFAFTSFQLIDIATANYGFFCYISLALHLFLLDDRDLERAYGVVRMRVLRRKSVWAPRPIAALPPWRVAVALFVGVAVAVPWLGLSLHKGIEHFGRPAPWPERASALRAHWDSGPRPLGTLHGERELAAAAHWAAPLRLVNNYHLFGHITRERPEAEIQVRTGGDEVAWQPLDFHYKAGPLDRAGPYVAPHQPRVDFLLWFYGLGHQQGTPGWVRRLVDRLCREPSAVQSLFVTPLPAAPEEARIAFWSYRFTSPAERSATGNYWKREPLATTAARPCR